MIIAVDLGNTAITIGVYQDDKLIAKFFTMTDKNKSSHEYVVTFSELLKYYNIDPAAAEGVILSTVVPSLKNTLCKAFDVIFKVKTVVVGPALRTGLAILTDYPTEVGSDLVAASVGALTKYKPPLVIADLGTATKIIAVSQNGAFVGVSIAPGIQVSFDALIGKASQLKEINLYLGPKAAIGKNTADSLTSGVLLGHAEMVNGLTRKINQELGGNAELILTGGHAPLIRQLIDPSFIYDETVLLDGLLAIYQKNRVSLRSSHEK